MNRDHEIRQEPHEETNHDHTDHTDDTGELVGRGVGGLGGAVVGASAGAVAGPVGMIIGGIAGATGGWWAGNKVADVVEEMEAEDESRFREHYEAAETGVPKYEDARVGYLVGSAASRHPGYRDRDFEDIEADLRQGFTVRDDDWSYSYDEMRPYIREGYTRGRT